MTSALEHIESLPTPEQRARAATDLIAPFEEGKRAIALARIMALEPARNAGLADAMSP